MERACHDNPKLIYDYYDVLRKEGAARELHELHEQDEENHAEPDSNGPIMVASAANGRNPMDYLDLASKNFNHFSEKNAESKKLFSASIVMNPAYATEIADASSKFGHNIAQAAGRGPSSHGCIGPALSDRRVRLGSHASASHGDVQ